MPDNRFNLKTVKPHDPIYADQWNAVIGTMRSNIPGGRGFSDADGEYRRERLRDNGYVQVYSHDVIAAYGIVELYDSYFDQVNGVYYHARKTTDYDLSYPRDWAGNGPFALQADAYGWAKIITPSIAQVVRINSGSTLAYGDQCRPDVDGQTLKPHYAGHLRVTATDGVDFAVVVYDRPLGFNFTGTHDACVIGESIVLDLGDGQTLTVHSEYGAVTENAPIWIQWDHKQHFYMVLQQPCPAE